MNKAKQRKAASIHQRLLNKARESGRPFNELLQYYAMERFLFRMSRSDYADDFTLKGALLLRTLGISEIRSTRDIDLLGPDKGSIDTLKKSMAECCRIRVEEDGLTFDANDIEAGAIRENQAYNGYRFKIKGSLGNARISIQVDMGFGDVITPGPLWIEYPSILDQQPVRIKAYTVESAIAEKYQAMVDLDLLNSRMKDFFDIYYLSTHLNFEGEKLREAIKQTFKRRKTDIPENLPAAFTDAFYKDENTQKQWKAFRKKLNSEHTLPEFEEVIQQVKAFLWPLTDKTEARERLAEHWHPEKGWTKNNKTQPNKG